MRSILVPLQGYDSDGPSVEAALDVAALFGSRVTALLAVPRPLMPVVYGTTPATFTTMIAHMESHVEAMGQSARRTVQSIAAQRAIHFGDAPAGMGHASIELVIADGGEDVMVAQYATVNDLVVFCRKAPSDHEAFNTPPIVKDMLENCGRPLLIVNERIPVSFPKSAAIAWNGSVEGARAVTAALPLLAKAEAIAILTAETSKTSGLEGSRLSAYLGCHGVRAQTITVPVEGRSVGEALHDAAQNVGADLMVMGGFTRSRFSQVFFGGVTSYILDNYRGTIIIAH